jgi:PAS domain S-box-containing protein
MTQEVSDFLVARPVLRRLLVPLAALVLALVLGAGGLLWGLYSIERVRVQEEACATLLENLGTAIDEQERMLGTQAEAIAVLPGVGDALRAADRDALRSQWEPVFRELHESGKVTHLNFYAADRTTVLRLHRPGDHGDRIDRTTLKAAQASRAAQFGLEVGRFGTLVLRAVHPVSPIPAGNPEGFVEVGTELSNMLGKLSKGPKIEFGLALSKEVLPKEQWTQWLEQSGQAGEWDAMAEQVWIYSSFGEVPAEFSRMLCGPSPGCCRQGGRVVRIPEDGGVWRMASSPLVDAAGVRVGRLAVMIDQTVEEKALKTLLATGGAVAAALFVAILWLVVSLLARTDERLRQGRLALKAERDLAQTYLDLAGVAFLAIDRDGIVRLVNRAGCELLGCSREEIEGGSWFDRFVPEAGREEIKRVFRRIMDGDLEQVREYENAIVGADGREKIVAWRNTLLRDADGVAVSTLSSGMDVTEPRRLQAERAELAKAESLGRMAGAVAHHYNNLMQVVQGNLEIAVENFGGAAETVEEIESALSAARRASEIGGMMLAYLGETYDCREQVDLAEVCRSYMETLRAAVPARVALECAVGDAPVPVEGNAEQLRKLLSILAVNAWESLGDLPGKVSVAVRSVAAGDLGGFRRFPADFQPVEGAHVCIEVADTGCGIAAENLPSIFDPFYTTKFTGRGMGLPIALAIAKGCGGGIAVQSQPGKGSRFVVCLRARR